MLQAEILTETLSLTDEEKPLPKGWRLVLLGEVCESFTGTTDPRKTPDKSFHYVDISSVDNSTKRIVESRAILGKYAPSRARQVIRTNDVIVATTRPNLNAVAYVPESLDGEVCSTGFCVLRATKDLDSKYLFSFVQDESFIESLSELVKGALYPAVTDKQVKSQFIPLPPTIEEQRRIASILDEQMKAVEQVRLTVKEQLAAANLLPNAFLRSVFESEEAQGWQKKKVGDVCAVTKLAGFEYTKYVKYVPDGEYIALRAQNVRNDGLDLRNVVRISKEVASVLNRSRLDKNDVVMTFIGANIGEATWIAESDTFYCAPNIAKLTPDPEFVDHCFLTLAIQSRPFQQQIQEINASTAQQSLSMRDIRNFTLPVPPIEEQKKIAGRLNEQMQAVETLKKSLTDKLEAVKKLPAALLRNAFTGEI